MSVIKGESAIITVHVKGIAESQTCFLMSLWLCWGGGGGVPTSCDGGQQLGAAAADVGIAA